MFGVVVIGVGLAGQARIRDLLSATSGLSAETPTQHMQDVTLRGYVSRRSLQIPHVQQLLLEDVLANDDINVAIICTENEGHEELARQCIEAGKHTLVEFPLARSAEYAVKLLTLAKSKGVLCYEEDISLLTESHAKLKSLVKNKTGFKSGCSYLKGGFNGWIENMDKSGSPFHSSVSQIHRLVDCFGMLVPVSACIVTKDKSLQAEGVVKTNDEGLITITLQREQLDITKREVGFRFEFHDGSVIDSESIKAFPKADTGQKKPGLFMMDFMNFMDHLRNGMTRISDQHENIIIHSLQLADALFDLAKVNPKSIIRDSVSD